MKYDYSNPYYVIVTAYGYIKDLLDFCNVTGFAITPAKNDLFNNPESPKLSEQKKWFYSVAYRLQYLAKRTRPDILLAVTVLSGRVQNPTENDRTKVERVLKYLNFSRLKNLKLGGIGGSYGRGPGCKIFGSVDTSSAVHLDMKSHTGSTASLGRGLVHSKSGKQKMVTNSSAESELVGVSDRAG